MYENLFPVDVAKCGEYPCWSNPDPLAYSWTPPPNSLWEQLFGGGMIGDAVNFLGSMLMEFLASGLYLAILIASYLSDPAWIMNPVADKLAVLFRAGYDNVFLRFVPLLLLFTVIYIVWQYAKGDHVKIAKGIASTLLSAGLIVLFFFNFGTAFKWLNEVGNGLTTQVGISLVKTVNADVNSQYEMLWKTYVLYPWEYGQFGQVSSKIRDFNVAASVAGSVYTDDAGNEKTLSTSDNWVRLLLENTSPEARESLVEVLFGDQQPALAGQLETKAPNSVNPYQSLVVMLLIFLFILPVIVFLVYLGFQLFIRQMLFLTTMFLGIVTVPMAFVPEIGWRVTIQWMREGLGHLVERLAIVIYGCVTFAVAGLITEGLMSAGTGMGLMIAIVINAVVFTAAILYRNQIFGRFVHPMADRVRFQSGKAQGAYEEDVETEVGQQGGRLSGGRSNQQPSSPGLASRFQSNSSKNEGGARGARSAQSANEEKPAAPSIFGLMKRQVMGVQDVSRPTTQEERVQNREAATRTAEKKLNEKVTRMLVPSAFRKDSGDTTDQSKPRAGRKGNHGGREGKRGENRSGQSADRSKTGQSPQSNAPRQADRQKHEPSRSQRTNPVHQSERSGKQGGANHVAAKTIPPNAKKEQIGEGSIIKRQERGVSKRPLPKRLHSPQLTKKHAGVKPAAKRKVPLPKRKKE